MSEPSRARQWLISGGGGHEDGEDGICASTFSGEAVVETLEAYEQHLLAIDSAKLEQAMSRVNDLQLELIQIQTREQRLVQVVVERTVKELRTGIYCHRPDHMQNVCQCDEMDAAIRKFSSPSQVAEIIEESKRTP